MKKYITRQQLEELKPEAFLKLEKWLNDRNLRPLPYHELGEWKGYLPSIGDLIEFLDEYEEASRFHRLDRFAEGWIINGSGERFVPELCDALFSAVRELLENNEYRKEGK